MPQRTCGGQRTACGSWSSLFTLWFLGIEALILRLGAGAFTCGALFPRAASLRCLQRTHPSNGKRDRGFSHAASTGCLWVDLSVCHAPRLLSPLDEILSPLYTLKDPHTKENLRWGRGLNGRMSGSGDLSGMAQHFNTAGCLCTGLGALSSHLG